MSRPPKASFLLLVIVVVLTGCASDKIWVGGVTTIDDESEIEKGAAQHQRIVEQAGLYNDSKLSSYVESVGMKIATASDRSKLKWHFSVLDVETPNAFATQGGYVYITRGMLALLESEAELAAILAHETAHICNRDTPNAERVGNIMGLGVLGALVAAPALILLPQVAAAPAAAGMASISRKNELNADMLGTEYLRRAGYPPESMATTFAVLANMEAYERDRQKDSGRNPYGWWHRIYASHPTTEKRQEKLTESTNLRDSSVTVPPQPEFLARLEGLEMGSSKFEGFPYKNKRYFSQWKIALEIPNDWFVYLNKPRAQLWLIHPDKKAHLIVEQTSSISLDQPCETLRTITTPSPVTEAKPIAENGPASCSGLVHKSIPSLFSSREQIFRAGVMAESNKSGVGFIFRGYADDKVFSETDPIFMSVARSIESITASGAEPRPYSLHVHRTKSGDTFASLARGSRYHEKHAENLLRLLNRRYPNGEPKLGELIKIIE